MKKIFLVCFISLILSFFPLSAALSKTPTLLSGALMSTIRSLKLPVEIENGLLEKVKEAHEKLSSSNAKVFKSSINQLKAFENQVRAQRGKNISPIQADALLRQSSRLMDLVTRMTVKTVGTLGGIVAVSNPSSPIYGAYVSVPAGALGSDTLITIVEETSPRPVSTNVTPCGPVVRFGPEGFVFNKPVEIGVPVYPDCNNPEIFTSPLHGEEFKKVEGSETNRGLLITKVNHFSNFQAGSEGKEEGTPYFDWTILLNVTLPGGKRQAHMNAFVVHPDCPDPSDFFCIPDKIKSITITRPGQNGFEYRFIKGDYWFDVCHKIINEVYATDYPHHWYYAHKGIEQDLESGQYTFTMTYEVNGEEKSVSINRNIEANPLPIVDRSKVEICYHLDQSGSCLDWRSADLLEGVPTDKPLKIRWEPVFYESGPVYYQVRIHNWMGTLPIFRSPLVTGTEGTIPVEIIRRILIENATYIMRIWAFDDATIPNSHNRSQSGNIRFATGSISFEESPIFDYARVVRSNFLGQYFEVNFAARVRGGLTGEILTNEDVEVHVSKPNHESLQLTNWTAAGDVWQIIPNIEQPVGEYIFKASLKNDPDKYVYLKDYYYRPRSLPIPKLKSPGTPWPQPIPTIETLSPTFSWEPVDGAKSYELLLEKWVGGESPWQRIFTSNWVEEPKYILPFVLENGNTYRWRIRAYDSFSDGTNDSRSNTPWFTFAVSVP